MPVPPPCDVLDAETREGPPLTHASAVPQEEAGAEGNARLPARLAVVSLFVLHSSFRLPDGVLRDGQVDLVPLAAVHDRLELR